LRNKMAGSSPAMTVREPLELQLTPVVLHVDRSSVRVIRLR
jgi:hypothetical protein